MKRKPSLVKCRIVDEHSRVACALHHTLDKHEGPLWLMIPVDEEMVRRLEAVALMTHDEEVYVHEIDKESL